MRTQTVPAVLAGVALMFAASAARADDVTGVYDVKFEQVSTNCASPLNYPHGKLTIIQKANQVTVEIDNTPRMTGVPAKNGKISAKSKPGGATMIEGMLGVFSVAGRVTPDGLLHVVMVGEYTAQGKPLCSQSWNVSGPRNESKPAKPAKK
jgi:hypothetical protein